MEQVILIDEDNNQIGVADKATVHTTNTPLHRAFSLFLFNSQKQLLVTQRARHKKTFPGVWTNTLCGHVSPGETTTAAAARRLQEELGIMLQSNQIREVAPYRYRFADQNGIVENEICPILKGTFEGEIKANPDEVDGWKWVDWQEFLKELRSDTRNIYSPWCKEEAELIEKLGFEG